MAHFLPPAGVVFETERVIFSYFCLFGVRNKLLCEFSTFERVTITNNSR